MRGFPIEKGAATIPTVLQDPCCHPWGTSALETKLYKYERKQTTEMTLVFVSFIIAFLHTCVLMSMQTEPLTAAARCQNVVTGLQLASHPPERLQVHASRGRRLPPESVASLLPRPGTQLERGPDHELALRTACKPSDCCRLGQQDARDPAEDHQTIARPTRNLAHHDQATLPPR